MIQFGCFFAAKECFNMINRPFPLQKLMRFKDKQLVKVVTGIRRCGKSTLLELFRKQLLKQGVNPSAIQSYNFEDLSLEPLTDYHRLYDTIVSRLQLGGMNYVFIDEIQNVPKFEKVINSLLVKGNVDIYITGSNAFLLSGELATLLSGRTVEIHVTPLSFAELFGGNADMKSFQDYMGGSSFPYAHQLETASDVHTYLEGVYNTVILKDIAARRGIVDINQLQRVARFLMGNIGNLTSIKKISDTMASDGQRISTHAVDSYISSLVEAYLFYPVRRFDVKGRQLLKTGEKYYVADLGLRDIVLGVRDSDYGHALENIVFLELIRRGWSVFVGKVGPQEIDFIAQKDMKTVYYQVSLTILDESTKLRELGPLEKVGDSFPKYLLTMDLLPQSTHNGIFIKNVVDWLVEED